jgi:hypothetical protein
MIAKIVLKEPVEIEEKVYKELYPGEIGYKATMFASGNGLSLNKSKNSNYDKPTVHIPFHNIVSYEQR